MLNKITLEQIEFFAYHGVFEEEQKIGNRYSVDITVFVDFSATETEDSIKNTVNYGKLYEIVKEQMMIPSKLLEHIAYKIKNKVFESFAEVEGVEIKVSKFNPPIGGNCQRATVSLQENRK
ncbi:MAG: dihydroneopterin aldolase [Bacteroidetes bacterium]|nr:MAG: dihydroneopterin aldolase [Bacteroidota bacterium]